MTSSPHIASFSVYGAVHVSLVTRQMGRGGQATRWGALWLSCACCACCVNCRQQMWRLGLLNASALELRR